MVVILTCLKKNKQSPNAGALKAAPTGEEAAEEEDVVLEVAVDHVPEPM